MENSHKSAKLSLRFFSIACTVGVFAASVFGFFDIQETTNIIVSNVVISLYAAIFGVIMLMTEVKYQRLVSAVPLFQRYEGRGFLHLFIGMLIVGTSTFGLVVGIITALNGLLNVVLFYKYRDIYDDL